MDKETLQCYRVNYALSWRDDMRGFPAEGAIYAIHTLCNEVERLQQGLHEAGDGDTWRLILSVNLEKVIKN